MFLEICHLPHSLYRETVAGTTGLEPATSAVTGQRSNQLSYVPNLDLPEDHESSLNRTHRQEKSIREHRTMALPLTPKPRNCPPGRR